MIANPLIRVIMLVAGAAFTWFGIRDAGDGPATLAAGVGLGLTILPFVLTPGLKPGEVDARPGGRELDGADRRGTLLVPARRYMLALALSSLGLAVLLGGIAGLVAAEGGVAAVVGGVVVGLFALLAALAAAIGLRKLPRLEEQALVLTPEGLGPLGVTAQWTPWEDVEEVKLNTSAESSLLSPTVEVHRVKGPRQRMKTTAVMEPVRLAAVLEHLRTDPDARRDLAAGRLPEPA